MSGKSFFVDLTKCTACRGCQVACKQWHGLPAEQTHNFGSHQNPADLSFNTYKLVRFEEKVIDGHLQWLFFPEQCRHCVDAPCMGAADREDSILQDEATGAVIFTEKTAKDDFEAVKDACPYNIPRQQEGGKQFAKCDMCLDRVQHGMLPACVLTCPTGAMNFGDREDMLELAKISLKKAKKRWPKATLVDPDFVRVIYLAAFPPEDYYENLTADNGTGVMSRKTLLAGMGKPVRRIIG